jgi:hypothetical protein
MVESGLQCVSGCHSSLACGRKGPVGLVRDIRQSNGGNRSRCISRSCSPFGGEYVIAFDGKPTPINVFCVEQCEWSARASGELTSLRAAQSNVTLNSSVAVSGGEKANVLAFSVEASRKFIGAFGNLNKQSRLAL